MKILYILRSRPDITVEKFMQTVTNGDQADAILLRQLLLCLDPFSRSDLASLDLRNPIGSPAPLRVPCCG